MSYDFPLISVIIPSYNRSHCVCDAILSVMSQTFTDYEIIVIDDGSTDNTKEALQPYLSKIAYIFQENKGVSAARNTGIRAAKGKWIAFLDSDDEWLPGKLEQQVKDVSQYPDAVLSCSNISFEGKTGMVSIDFLKTCRNFVSHQVEFIQEPLFKSYAFTSTVLARRDAIHEVGLFDEELSIHEDSDLFYRLSLLGGFTVNPAILARAYRRDEPVDVNLSIQALNDSVKNYKSLIKIFQKLLNEQLQAKQRVFVQEKLSSSWFDLGLVYHRMKYPGKARRCFFIFFQTQPSFGKILKFLVGLSGSAGISLLEQRRNAKSGFRRSVYYRL